MGILQQGCVSAQHSIKAIGTMSTLTGIIGNWLYFIIRRIFIYSMPHGFVNMRIFIVEENSEKSSVSRLEIFILIKRDAVLEEATVFLFIIHVQSWNAYIVCLTEILNYISLDNPCRTRVCQFTVTAVLPWKLQSSHGSCGHPMETAVVLWKLWSAHGMLQVEMIAQRKWYIFLYCEIPTNGLFVYHPNRCILFTGSLFTNSD